jgi:glucokinase
MQPLGIIAAADVGGTTIKLALVRDSVLINRSSIPAEAAAGLAPALENMVVEWKNLCRQAGILFEEIGAFGLSFPGVVDPATERVWITPEGKFDDARDIDLREWAHRRLRRPIVVCNDAKAALVGEWRMGAARGVNNAVMMTLGTGVGTAVIVNGALMHGAHGLAGNAAGHVTINLDGARCLCGNIGCVEAEASSWAIRSQAESHPLHARSALAKADPLDYKAVFEAAQGGDPLATEIREHSLRAWAACAVGMVNNFDPELVVIGGGVAADAAIIIPHISDSIRDHAWAQWDVPVVAAQLGNNAGVLGIAHLAGEQL